MPEPAKYDAELLPQFLKTYYKRIFPYPEYIAWLKYGNIDKTYLVNREFSFTLKDDIYIRYQSFADQIEFENEIQRKLPYKIDVGAVYSHKPKDHNKIQAGAFQPREKELVFDIDMTDYDDVRSCCQGADICPKCWPLMQFAINIVDTALRDDFGFKHVLWVYSGRRGVHCWVCDENARKLAPNFRSAVVDYLSIVRGGENQAKKVSLPDIVHPSIKRAIEFIDEQFEQYAIDLQDFMGTEEKVKKILPLVPFPDDRKSKFEELVISELTSKARWIVLKKIIEQCVNEPNCSPKMKHALSEIKLQFCYPRLDVNVSKGVNHLLKSPFCVHPKTGRVCVPIDPSDVSNFDPFQVPTIEQLIEELPQTSECPIGDDEPKLKRKDYRMTSLKNYMKAFDDFLHKLAESWKGKMIEASDSKMEF